MVFRSHYPITHVAIYDTQAFRLGMLHRPVITLVFYGLAPSDFTWTYKWGEDRITAYEITCALKRRGLEPDRYCTFSWSMKEAECEYVTKYTPRSYIKRGAGDYYGPSF